MRKFVVRVIARRVVTRQQRIHERLLRTQRFSIIPFDSSLNLSTELLLLQLLSLAVRRRIESHLSSAVGYLKIDHGALTAEGTARRVQVYVALTVRAIFREGAIVQIIGLASLELLHLEAGVERTVELLL